MQQGAGRHTLLTVASGEGSAVLAETALKGRFAFKARADCGFGSARQGQAACGGAAGPLDPQGRC
ncbi:hypothetical protein RA20_16905 [Leisingera sp. ANG-Vp]|nr:hypothetical protein RA20_16905 [Leisingera sp. ANG-Vp]